MIPSLTSFLLLKVSNQYQHHNLNVAKCNLGEVKLERIGLQLSPIAVHGIQSGPLGSCRASKWVCSQCYTALLLCLLIIADQLFLFGESLV